MVEFSGDFLGLLADLGQEPQPEKHELSLRKTLRRKFRQLDKNKLQPVDALAGIGHVHNPVMVIPIRRVRTKDRVDEIQRINRLQALEFLPWPDLPHIRLGGVEKHTAEKTISPQHLHLHNEMPSLPVATPHIDNAVPHLRNLGNQLGRQVFDFHHLTPWLQRQQGIEKTD